MMGWVEETDRPSEAAAAAIAGAKRDHGVDLVGSGEPSRTEHRGDGDDDRPVVELSEGAPQIGADHQVADIVLLRCRPAQQTARGQTGGQLIGGRDDMGDIDVGGAGDGARHVRSSFSWDGVSVFIGWVFIGWVFIAGVAGSR